MTPLCSDFLLEADRFAQFAHTARLSLTVARAELCVEQLGDGSRQARARPVA